MTLTQLIQLAVIPAALIVLGGVLVRRKSDRLGEGRPLVFVLSAADALLPAAFVANRLTSASDRRPGPPGPAPARECDGCCAV